MTRQDYKNNMTFVTFNKEGLVAVGEKEDIRIYVDDSKYFNIKVSKLLDGDTGMNMDIGGGDEAQKIFLDTLIGQRYNLEVMRDEFRVLCENIMFLDVFRYEDWKGKQGGAKLQRNGKVAPDQVKRAAVAKERALAEGDNEVLREVVDYLYGKSGEDYRHPIDTHLRKKFIIALCDYCDIEAKPLKHTVRGVSRYINKREKTEMFPRLIIPLSTTTFDNFHLKEYQIYSIKCWRAQYLPKYDPPPTTQPQMKNSLIYATKVKRGEEGACMIQNSGKIAELWKRGDTEGTNLRIHIYNRSKNTEGKWIFHTYIICRDGERVVDVSNGLVSMCPYQEFVRHNNIKEDRSVYLDLTYDDYLAYMSYKDTKEGEPWRARLETTERQQIAARLTGGWIPFKDQIHINVYSMLKRYLDLFAAETLCKKPFIEILYYNRKDDLGILDDCKKFLPLNRYMTHIRKHPQRFYK